MFSDTRYSGEVDQREFVLFVELSIFSTSSSSPQFPRYLINN